MLSNIGISVFRKQDYKQILELSEDRETMEPTWEAWKAGKEKAQRVLRKRGVNTIDILVLPSQLLHYCQRMGLKVNGMSRAMYVSGEARRWQS